MDGRKLQVALEIVTPLFLGGANPRGEPELRAASFRGVLRFWLRALLGGVLGNDTEKIFEHESKVFGSTEHASPVIVRVGHRQPTKTNYSQLTQNKTGLAYLLFSARRTRSEPERRAIEPKQQFDLTCQLHSSVQNLLPLEAAYASLWLLTHLGGIGSRSRRGAGNLQVQKVLSNDLTAALPSLQIQAKTPQELRSEMVEGLKGLRQWAAKAFNGSLQPLFGKQPDFDVLHPQFCKIWVASKTFRTWDEALNEFGSAMQQFRRRREPDYSNVKAVIQSNKQLQPVKRAAFGLPIVFYYRSLGGTGGILEGSEHDRRASPLIVRVIKLADGGYALVLLRFIAPLLPAGEQMKLRQGNRELSRAQLPDDSILQDFMAHLQSSIGSLLEVSRW